jgi:hypothetical protein
MPKRIRAYLRVLSTNGLVSLKVIILAQLHVAGCSLIPSESSQEQGGASRVRIMGVFEAYLLRISAYSPLSPFNFNQISGITYQNGISLLGTFVL